ncbi:hypothetical protein GTO27_03405 [Candidatus Bathyarchaeota archaeon]|nr:hypothetical protein [Candidatus Bathyarchaeota archaeon]
MKKTRRRKYEGALCGKEGCGKQAVSKGFCWNHYWLFRYKTEEEFRRKSNVAKSKSRMKRYHTDPVFREKLKAKNRQRTKEYYRKKCQEDPDWGAKRQRKYREKHPEAFKYIMAKCYLRKLSPEKRAKLMREIRKEESGGRVEKG